MKLKNKFNKYDKQRGEILALEREKQELEILNKDNEVLQKYIQLCNEIAELNKEISSSEIKDYFYEEMSTQDIPELKGKYCYITLKKPYYRKSINTTKFFEDNDPNSRLYKKYVEQKLIKGNVTVKDSEEISRR